MKFSEAIAILELEEGMDEVTGLTTAYRAAVKKYHPDVTKLEPDFALEMSKTVNAAYSFLLEHRGKWSVADKGKMNLADVMVDTYNKICHLPDITIIPKGVWLWVTIGTPLEFTFSKNDTFEERMAKKKGLAAFRKGLGSELRKQGFKYSGKHKKWSWHNIEDGPKKWKRKGWDWNRIDATFNGEELKSTPHMAMA